MVYQFNFILLFRPPFACIPPFKALRIEFSSAASSRSDSCPLQTRRARQMGGCETSCAPQGGRELPTVTGARVSPADLAWKRRVEPAPFVTASTSLSAHHPATTVHHRSPPLFALSRDRLSLLETAYGWGWFIPTSTPVSTVQLAPACALSPNRRRPNDSVSPIR